MLPVRGCHPLRLAIPGHSGHIHGSAGPRSLAATRGVSIDFLSSGYLDVSVPRVRFLNPMYSGLEYLVQLTDGFPREVSAHCQVGCPIRRSMDQSLFSAPHRLSQSITSFIASCCQGIHQTPFSRLIRSRRSEAPSVSEAYYRNCDPGWFVRAQCRPGGRRFRLVYLTWKFHAVRVEPADPAALAVSAWNRCVSL